jgi:transposase
MFNCQSSMPLFFDLPLVIKSSKTLTKYQLIFEQLDKLKIPDRQYYQGRKPYPKTAMIKALIIQFLSSIPTIAELTRTLDANPILAEMCGFQMGNIPHPSVFTRFLKQINTSSIEQLLTKTVKNIIEDNDVSTDVLLIDSKPILANTKHNNPKCSAKVLNKSKLDHPARSPKARLTYLATVPIETGQQQILFGWAYREHTIITADGIPLATITLPGDVKDHIAAKKLIKKVKRKYGTLKGKIIIADAGYDVKEIYDLIVNQMKAKPIIPINPRNTKRDTTDIDPKTDTPICKAGLHMSYCGLCKEANRTRKKYRCLIKVDKQARKIFGDKCPIDCEKFDGYGCTRYIDVTNDARAMIDRTSAFFVNLYSLRIGAEQYFSRLSVNEFERTNLFNFKAIRNQMKIRHLALALVAAAAYDIGRADKIRAYKTFVESAA